MKYLPLVAVLTAVLATACGRAPLAAVRPDKGASMMETAGMEKEALRLFAQGGNDPSIGLKLLTSTESLLSGASLSRDETKSVLFARFLALGTSGAAVEMAQISKRLASLDPRDGRAVWTAAALEKDPQKRLAYLEKFREKGGGPAYARLLSALTLENLGKTADAAAAWESSLPLLPPDVAEFFRPRRDSAFAMLRAGKTPVSSGWIAAKAVRWKDALDSCAQSGCLPEGEISGGLLDGASLMPVLRRDGFLPAEVLDSAAVVRRAELAWFLRAVMEGRKKSGYDDISVKMRFTKSPIPDVPLESPCFSAVIACVETEILTLPDGVHFSPEGALSGKDWAETLKTLSEYR